MRNKFFGYEGDPESKSTVHVKEHFFKMTLSITVSLYTWTSHVTAGSAVIGPVPVHHSISVHAL